MTGFERSIRHIPTESQSIFCISCQHDSHGAHRHRRHERTIPGRQYRRSGEQVNSHTPYGGGDGIATATVPSTTSATVVFILKSGHKYLRVGRLR